MRKIAIIFIIILSMQLMDTKASVSFRKPKIEVIDSLLYPEYSRNVTDYYIKDCNDKLTKIKLTYNNKINNKGYFFKEGDSKRFKFNNNDITITCLPEKISRYNYEFMSYKKNNGYTVIDREQSTAVYDNKGVPIWFRRYQNYSPYFTKFDNNGVMTTLLVDFNILRSNSASLDASRASVYVLKYDLLSDKIKNIITPYEIIDGVRKYPPIDYHSFHESKTGYYFISYDDVFVDKIPEKYNIESFIIDACNKRAMKTMIRTPRIIKTDFKGEVIWSYSIVLDSFSNKPFVFFEDSSNSSRCYLDINHPNHVSADENEKIISIGMRNTAIILINKDKEILGTFLNNDNSNADNLTIYDSKKLKSFNIINDPNNNICSTHSGFITENKEIIIYDNRCNSNESSRAVIYDYDLKNLTANYKKSILLSENIKNCSTTPAGRINCNSLAMGAALFTNSGNILINWGDIPKSRAVLSIYNKKYEKILDIYGDPVDNKNIRPVYQSNYYDKNEFEKLAVKIKKIDKSLSSDKKRNYELTREILS
jgi:hypothetical protein